MNVLTGFTGSSELSLTAAPYYHKTTGLSAVWSVPAKYDADLASNLDIGGYSYLSVNLVQKYSSASNPVGQPQRFHISLADANGNAAKLDNTDVAPWPYPFNVGTNGPVKSVLKTFRFPIGAFTSQNPQIDLTKMRHVIVDFDITPTGEFALDNVAITPVTEPAANSESHFSHETKSRSRRRGPDPAPRRLGRRRGESRPRQDPAP